MRKEAQRVSAALALLAASMCAAAQPAAIDFRLSPRNHQDAEQQWFDRYDCDGQARRQSGYDPGHSTAQSSGPAEEEYIRAMIGCLRRQGYDVRYAPPESPPPPSPAALYEPPAAAPPARELRYRPLSVEAGGGYSVAAGSTGDYVHGGAHAAVALDWFPNAAWPVGVRIQGSYTWLTPASALFTLDNTRYNRAEQELYGGDLDLRLNLSPLPSRQQFYLVAGIGWYRLDTSLEELSGVRTCGVRFCGVFPTILAQEHNSSPWEPSWNAGLGWEIAIDSHTAFFIEARYQHFNRYDGESQLVPISLGLRF